MSITGAAVEFLKRLEGCRLTAYRDAGQGVWTIGYGRAYGVREGDTISQANADAMLAQDLELFARGVDRLVKIPLTENQRTALIAFSFNVGLRAFGGSRLLMAVNERRFHDVPAELQKWTNAGGHRLPGLVRRRAAEAELFNA